MRQRLAAMIQVKDLPAKLAKLGVAKLTVSAAVLALVVGGLTVVLPDGDAAAAKGLRVVSLTEGPDTSDGLERYVLDVPEVGPAYGEATAQAVLPAKVPARASRAAVRSALRAECAPDLSTNGTGGWRNLPQVDLSTGTVPSVPGDCPPVAAPAPDPTPVQAEPAAPAHDTRSAVQRRSDALAALAAAPGVVHVTALRAGGVLVAVQPGTDVEHLPGVVSVVRAQVYTLNANDKSNGKANGNKPAEPPVSEPAPVVEQKPAKAEEKGGKPEEKADQPVAVEQKASNDNGKVDNGKVDTAAKAAAKAPAGNDKKAAAEAAAPLTPPNDPYFDLAWALHNTGTAPEQPATAGVDTGALVGWQNTQGAGAVIAVIDTGVNVAHPDLAANIWANPKQKCDDRDGDGNGKAADCQGWNFYRDNADVTNAGGGTHGTGVAGATVAAANNGIGAAGLAPKAAVLPIVVGAGTSIVKELVPDAIYYAVDEGAHVINLSFGGPADSPEQLAALKAAFDYAAAHDVNIVSAAGNDAADRDAQPLYPASIASPIKLTVGAHTAADTVAAFSAYGRRTVDLFAPGSQIAVTTVDGGYGLASGTSVAAPLVSAAIALVKAESPEIDAPSRADLVRGRVVPGEAYAATSVSGGRLSVGALVGGDDVASFRWSVLGRPQAGEDITPTLIAKGAGVPEGSDLQLTLATRFYGKVYVVPSIPFRIGNTTLTTDSRGRIRTAWAKKQGAFVLKPHFALPAGEYALVAQVMTGDTPVGRPAFVTFGVGGQFAAGAPAGDGSGTGAESGTVPGGTVPGGTVPGGDAGYGVAPDGSTVPGGTIPDGSGSWSDGPDSGPGAGTVPGGDGVAGYDPAAGSGGPGAPAGSGEVPGEAPGAPAGEGSTVPGEAPGAPAPAGNPVGEVAEPIGKVTVPDGSGPDASGGSSYVRVPDILGGDRQTDAGEVSTGYDGDNEFAVTAVGPTVQPLTGSLVTITGTNLPRNPTVTVEGALARVLSAQPTTVNVIVPARTQGDYDVTVSGGGKAVTYKDALSYRPVESSSAVGGGTAPGVNVGSGSGSASAPGGSTGNGSGEASTGSGSGSTGSGDTSTGGGSYSGGDNGSSDQVAGSVPGGSAIAPARPVTGPGGLQLVFDPELNAANLPWGRMNCWHSCLAVPF